MTDDNPFCAKLLATNEDQKNPLILYSVAAGGYYVREYAAFLSEIAESDWFRYETFESIYTIAKNNYEDLTQPEKEFHNTKGLYLSFGIDRTSDFSANGNISIREYLNAKLETLCFYLADVDKYADTQAQISTVWYIRGDFTDWQNDNDYVMTEENGLITVRLTFRQEARLKVYNDNTGAWYGTEYITEECRIPYGSDNHCNIVLSAGSYVLCFNPETEEITLEME